VVCALTKLKDTVLEDGKYGGRKNIDSENRLLRKVGKGERLGFVRVEEKSSKDNLMEARKRRRENPPERETAVSGGLGVSTLSKVKPEGGGDSSVGGNAQ